MMETETITLYTINELSEGARERALSDYRARIEYFWVDDTRESIEIFCDHFGVSLTRWHVDSCRYDFDTDATNLHFRGVKLRDFKRDHMPAGYCLDCDLWQTFFDVFKKTGDAKGAFDAALNAGFAAWRDDMGSQESAEYIGETLHANGWRFFADGRAYWGK